LNAIPLVAALVASIATGAVTSLAMADALEREIGRIGARTGAVFGVSARHLESGAERSYQAQLGFPMASTYKVAIGACALRIVDQGGMSLSASIPIEPRQRSTSSVLSSYFPQPGLAVSLHNLLDLMLTQSDNTATDVILEEIGGPPTVQRCLREAGVADMRVDRSTAQILRQYAGVPEPADPAVSFHEQFTAMLQRGEATAYFLDGSGAPYQSFERDPRDHATPEAMTRLLAILWQDEWLSPASGKVLRDILARSGEPVRLGRGLPADTRLAHKTGTLSGTVNDAGVFELPDGRGRVVITVYVKSARGPQERIEAAIGDVARAVYDSFVLQADSSE
jgi:beta-lactamase class A